MANMLTDYGQRQGTGAVLTAAEQEVARAMAGVSQTNAETTNQQNVSGGAQSRASDEAIGLWSEGRSEESHRDLDHLSHELQSDVRSQSTK